MAFDICIALNNDTWNSMNEVERFDFLHELVDTALLDWGYDPVDVVPGRAPNYAEAYYDRENDEIILDSDKIAADDYSAFDAASLAIHETLHAVDDQDYGGSYDYGGDQSESPVHNQLDLTAKAWVEKQIAACESAKTSIYPGRNTLPPIDWGA